MIKKIIILALFMIVLTGCNVEYNINIDKDLIIDESIKINELTKTILTQTLDVDIFLDRAIDDYQKDTDYDIYMYERYTDEKETYVTAKAFYLDFNSYKDNRIVKNSLFDNFNIIKEENIYNFIYVAKDKNDVEIFKNSELYSTLVDEVKVNITLPFRTISNNADTVDIETNTYTWIFKKNENLKNIDIKFDISKLAIKKETYGLYILIGLFGVITITVGYVAYKYKKYNKM